MSSNRLCSILSPGYPTLVSASTGGSEGWRICKQPSTSQQCMAIMMPLTGCSWTQEAREGGGRNAQQAAGSRQHASREGHGRIATKLCSP